MKRKILAFGVLSLCAVALIAAETHAFFGLLHPHHPYSLWNHHNRYTTHITCRPYNAFTPICWGNLVCDGCCPSPCGVAGGCLPMNIGAPPWCGNYGMSGMPCAAPCMGGSCGPDGACASDMPPQMGMQPYMGMQPQMGMPIPDVRTAPFMPPTPMPAGPGQVGYRPYANAQPMQMPMPMPWNGVAQANYSPNYYPAPQQGYYPMPMGYQPQPMWGYPQQIPYYWYGQGR